ncbi:MAG: DNA mismatch repair protein MutS [Candidatus Gastranaerophilales bacterium]|nr:DNA mismatch repair protein MutS [Candidatus Gastranaerophilales bacterium]
MTKTEINHVNSLDVNIEDTTPVMQQYLEIKKQHQDVILLYRLGDFYETFFEDAVIMSRELEITLTGRDAGEKLGRIPLAGIPAKAVDGYLEKLIEKNYKVAICEQLEDPKETKGLVKRGVVRLVTAGTLTESNLLKQNSNNYICAVFKSHKDEDLYGFAYTDISTGEFKTTQINLIMILSELARLQPSEIIAPAMQQKIMPFQIVPEEKVDLPDEILNIYNCSKVPQNIFETNFAVNNLKTVFKTNSLEAFGYENYKIGFQAAGALVSYIWETMKDNFPKFDRIEPYEMSQYVMIDASTRKNLELTETLREKNKYGSLLWAIDKTKTNMGARLLKSWICQPLKNIEEIQLRQDIIEELISKSAVRNELSLLLGKIYDIQRLSTRLSNGSANPRDFLSLKDTLLLLPELVKVTNELDAKTFEKLSEYELELSEFAGILDRTIKEDAPIIAKDGGVIKPEVSAELDYFNDLLTGGEKWLKEFEESEKERTGMKFLKVGYNKVFGYFIEISNSNLNLVPNNYVRKQTLTGAERFITDELKKHEDDVLSAQFKARELENKLFNDLKNYSKEYITKIREVAECIANIDVLTSLAATAIENNYTKPIVDKSNDFLVKNGRHAVLEKILPLGAYVANDLELAYGEGDKTEFMILTGPNMAGKSTFMRQNALIAILAQMGSFVPADYAKIGIVDKIFTRVGASDDLTLGQSTFMVEMIETAHILNSASEKSLILLDEIGRGTSTYDGVAIAWAVTEFIATKIKARCIFATHYHELNVMTNTYPQIKNYRITISEENGEIEFLRKIVQGGASKSYGIQVAKMAGLPNSVISRSQDLMNKMQKDFSSNLATRKKTANNEKDLQINVPQLNLFN